LKNLERQIFELETRYLEETVNSGWFKSFNMYVGNILKGWEGYL
jgi:hypothetical protein